MDQITTIDELRVLAQKNVPKMFFDYLESGSWTENTLEANINASNSLSVSEIVVGNFNTLFFLIFFILFYKYFVI